MGKVMKGITLKNGKFKLGKNGKAIENEVEDPMSLYKEDVLKIIGKKNWKQFSKWMIGQGAPIMSNGQKGYFRHDVDKFKKHYIDGIPLLTKEEVMEIIMNSTLHGKDVQDIIDKAEISGSVGGRINTRKWNSKRSDIKGDQHNPKKKWQTHVGLKRTKFRWNKKKGIREKSKKGSRDRIFWAD
jgi:hypothetical protein